MTYRRLWNALRRRWWLVPPGALIAVLAAVLTTSLMPPRYEATVRLLVGRVGGAVGFQPDLATDQQLAKTYAELAVTRSVLQEVIGILQLPMEPSQLAQRVKVKLMPDTRLMDVTVDNPDPDQAAAIATAIGNQLVSLGGADAADVGISIQRSLLDDLDSLSAELRRDQADLQDLETSLSAVGTADPELITRRDKLRTDVRDERRTRASLYDVLLRTAPSTGAVRLVSPAIAPLAPTNLGLAQAVGVSAPLGVLLALAVVFALEVSDRRLRHASQLPIENELPYLGGVPRFTRAEAEASVVARSMPDSAAGEAYRAIRTAVLARLGEREPQVVLLASARHGEGATRTVANLAALLAQVGRHVIAVDANFQRPALNTVFGVTADRGLVEVLQDEVSPTELLQPAGCERLLVLSAGRATDRATELLASPRMACVVSELRGAADVVLVDCAPVLSSDSPGLLAPHMDSVLLIAGAGISTPQEICRSRNLLFTAGARFLGAVLTRADMVDGLGSDGK